MSFGDHGKGKYGKYEGRPMVGSMHLNSDGYGKITPAFKRCTVRTYTTLFRHRSGYGARIHTARNQMTLPASVPLYRHPPDTPHFVQGCHSTQLVRADDKAVRRNADAVMRQTSGEVGFHYLGFDPEPIRLLKKPVREPHVHTVVPKTHEAFYSSISGNNNNNNVASSSSSHNNQSARGEGRTSARSLPATGRSIDSRWSNEYSRPSTTREESTPHVHTTAFSEHKREQFKQTLRTLDSSFGSQSRKDLFAASQPPKPIQEMVWVATSNNHSALQGRHWSNKLRRDER